MMLLSYQGTFWCLRTCSFIHKCDLLLSVYPHACSGTSVEELIVITYLWGMDLA